MAEVVTLTVPDGVAQQAKEAARLTGQSPEAVLAEWLLRGAPDDESISLMSSVEYPIYTPYGNEAAAQILLDYLNAHPHTNGIDEQP